MKVDAITYFLLVLMVIAGIYLKTEQYAGLLTALHSPVRPIAFKLHLLLGANLIEQTSHGQSALMEASSLCSLKYMAPSSSWSGQILKMFMVKQP